VRSVLSPLVPVAVCLLLPAVARAETFTVSPGDDYGAIEAAGPGDIVEIEPGTYQFRVFLDAVGSADAPIVIRATDPSNRPVFDLGGQNVGQWPGSYTGGDNGRGCWQVGGAYYQISGIEFRNCHTNSGNAAGIRARDADHLTVTDCLFEDNDAGFTGTGEEVTVEFSELVGNGQPGNPPQHNVYIYGGSFRLRYSYVHDSVGGQNLHIRARDAIIEHNWIARAANYEGDIMTGHDPNHTLLLRGNVFLGNASPGNGSTMWTLFNDSGDADVTMDITLVHNTIYLPGGSSAALVAVRNDSLTSASVTMHNNIVVGAQQAYRISDDNNDNVTVAGSNNWFETGIDVGALTGSLSGAEPGFNDLGALDFTLAAGSAAIGSADTNAPSPPDREYFENEDNPMKFRWRLSAADLGAFESTTAGEGFGPYDDPGQSPGTGGGGGGGASSSGPSGSGAGGNAGSGGAGSPGADDDGGCGCRTLGGTPGPSHGAAWLALVGLACLARRRRPA
jgi:MYXO-CTERM domain-containing protein